MDNTKKYLTISFIVVLIAVIIISGVGMLLLQKSRLSCKGKLSYRNTAYPVNARTYCIF